MNQESILNQYKLIVQNIEKSAEKVKRDAKNINLLAVSKFHEVNKIIPLLEIGHCHFGESRVQEAKSKWIDLKKLYPQTILHLIGPLQTNKVKDAIQLFDIIETLDREKLAEKIADELRKTGKNPKIFIQVNIGMEVQKSGIAPEELKMFLNKCRNDYALDIKGLMCIPPAGEDSVKYFLDLYNLAQKNGLEEISMGMSDDYQEAILSGATQVRIGSSLFGKRNYT
ncbi:YggS family pyridoxal phosphate-dependent enzyme [Ruminiclostridium cellulolyticum]|uniref:Pyridoxal phosphate homeostasis protein n=1 Tax=Ruminiclostridium cellulolyticum (strain ATCC 35319 / DSM 5812 / JCM 6584 / H10) TaxID=394503 RepID=B8I5Y2_RUMCH|nr:YggS family pyridoxal phosphate-dependent enzyme [Ruminiclostridium cellulolyticum]ACL74799.1 alanine racemase domain protein [Ruminiclostridium cellulolyticum H10]